MAERVERTMEQLVISIHKGIDSIPVIANIS